MNEENTANTSPAIVQVVPGLAEQERRREEELAEIRAFQRLLMQLVPVSWVTWSLVAANVGVYVAGLIGGLDFWWPAADRLVGWGAEYGPLTLGGQWWRMLTSAFLHGGLLHVAINMWALFLVGRFAERLFGHLGFLLLYVLSAVTAAMASLWWNPCGISVGASGAIFGIIGGLLGVSLARNESVPPRMLAGLRRAAISFLGYNLVLGLLIPIVDNAAHLGGFAGGVVFGTLLSRPVRENGRHNATARDVIVLVVGGAVLLGLGALVLPPAPGDYIAAQSQFIDVQDEGIATIERTRTAMRDGTIDSTEFVRIVREEILPPWDAATRRLEGLEGLTGFLETQNERMARFARLRYEAFEALADATETGDPAAWNRWLERSQAANEVLDELESAQPPGTGLPGFGG